MVAENAQPGKPDINKSLRVMSVENDDLLIEAMVPEKRHGLYKYISFRAAAIEHIAAFEVQNAEIVLHSGLSIPVGMDARELSKMIFEPDFKTGHKIDLTSMTGANVKAVWPENMKLRPGMEVADGSIYLGFDGGRDWYMAAKDICGSDKKTSINVSFNQAAAVALSADDHGHKDWKIPSQEILTMAHELLAQDKKGELTARFNFVSIMDYLTTTPYENKGDKIVVYNPTKGTSDWWSKEYTDLRGRLVRSAPRSAP
jgi:hypothetical protein